MLCDDAAFERVSCRRDRKNRSPSACCISALTGEAKCRGDVHSVELISDGPILRDGRKAAVAQNLDYVRRVEIHRRIAGDHTDRLVESVDRLSYGSVQSSRLRRLHNPGGRKRVSTAITLRAHCRPSTALATAWHLIRWQGGIVAFIPLLGEPVSVTPRMDDREWEGSIDQLGDRGVHVVAVGRSRAIRRRRVRVI